MVPLALRVLPGVLVAMMLAGPVLAAAQDSTKAASRDDAPEIRRTPLHGRKPMPAKPLQAALHRRVAASPLTTAFIDDAGLAWTQTGIASWYGGARWQGQRTSDGSRYDQDALTAAHATLPLGTRVRVTLPRSGTAVVVTITDRPGTRTRIIDLSRSAAEVLGILDQGLAMVTLSPG